MVVRPYRERTPEMKAIATRPWALLCMAAYCMLGNVIMLSHAELEQKLCKEVPVKATLAPGAHQGLQ